MSLGFDAGTYNLVCASRDESGNFRLQRQVNAFIEFSCEDDITLNMMKSINIPLVEREDVKMAYAIGEPAVRMAVTMGDIELKRPMRDGCVNPNERDAFEILKIMIHSLLDRVTHDQQTLVYTVPANAVNAETDADYHRKILEAIFNAYRSEEGYRVRPRPINEAMALAYAELSEKMYTGIAVSCGSGMVNVAFSLFGKEVFSFSIVNSGDWIDKQAAKASGQTVAYINREKTKLDLTKEPTTLVERAIRTQYELMIEKTVAGIKNGLEQHKDKKTNLDHPLDVIVAGGTSSPPGFDLLFKKTLESAGLPFELGEVIRPDEPLYSVAKGCLIAAERAKT